MVVPYGALLKKAHLACPLGIPRPPRSRSLPSEVEDIWTFLSNLGANGFFSIRFGEDKSHGDRPTSGGFGSKAKPRPEGKAVLRRLLLVGDSPFIPALRQSLGRTGACKALSALSGAEGLRAARTTVPDAILLDAALPDLISSEVCRRLRADPITEAIPLILLTDTSKRQTLEGTVEASAVASIPMGIDAVRLLNMIQTILTTRLTRRTAPRASVALGVDYRCADRGGTGKTLNLSQDGMFIVTPNSPEVGTELVLHFALPDSAPLEGTARVVWVRGPGEDHPYPAGMAVQFLELPPQAQQAITAFVTKLLATPASPALP